MFEYELIEISKDLNNYTNKDSKQLKFSDILEVSIPDK